MRGCVYVCVYTCVCVYARLLKSMLFSNLLNIQNNDRLSIVFENLLEPNEFSDLLLFLNPRGIRDNIAAAK